MDRNETIKSIRTALKNRSGKMWSVTGGRGTAWGWIRISAPPARLNEFGSMTDDDRAELGRLLGLDGPAHHQGESVAASSAYYREYVQRANGEQPTEIAKPYWD